MIFRSQTTSNSPMSIARAVALEKGFNEVANLLMDPLFTVLKEMLVNAPSEGMAMPALGEHKTAAEPAKVAATVGARIPVAA
jgi:hypothetical protein